MIETESVLDCSDKLIFMVSIECFISISHFYDQPTLVKSEKEPTPRSKNKYSTRGGEFVKQPRLVSYGNRCKEGGSSKSGYIYTCIYIVRVRYSDQHQRGFNSKNF